MRLSECREGSIVVILQNTSQCHAKDCRGIVVHRYPEDRVSGGTTVHFEDDGSQHTFVWDFENPMVKLEGIGKLVTVIVKEDLKEQS